MDHPPLSPHALVTIQATARDETTTRYASSPSANSLHNIGKCGNESLSFVLKPHFASAMYGHLGLEIRQYDAGGAFARPEIGRIVVFFKNIKGLRWEILDKDATRAELRVLNPKAKAQTPLSSLKLTFTTARAGYDVVNRDMRWLRKTNKKAGEDVDLLRKMVEDANPAALVPTSPLTVELLIAVRNDKDRGRLEGLCERLEKSIRCDRSKKAGKWSLAPWFQGIEGDQPLSMSDVPRLGPGFPETARQPALARFVDAEHYWVTQAVGAVNETVTTAKSSTVLLDARLFTHSKLSIDIDQFFVLVFPGGVGVKSRTNNSPATALSNRCEIQLLMPGWSRDSACSRSLEWSVWMFAQCLDHAVSWVPEGAHAYLVDLPCTPRIRVQIGGSLASMALSGNITTYECLKSQSSQQTFKIQMRPMGPSQTTTVELDSLQLLSTPSNYQNSFKLPIHAFEYLLNFTVGSETPIINLWEKLPGLANLVTGSRSSYRGSPLEWLNGSMREHQKLFMSLRYLTAGMAFLSHDHGTDIHDFILCILAAATFGIRKDQINLDKPRKKPKTREDNIRRTPLMCTSLFISSTSQNLENFAQEAHEFFTEHDFGSMPGILVISAEDAAVASALVTDDIPSVSLSSVGYEEADEEDTENMDVIDHFLMQVKMSGVHSEGEASGGSLCGRLTIHEASYQYYLMNMMEFSRMEELLRDLEATKELGGAESLELRRLVKKLYATMLSKFKGIVCTLATTAAHPWVQNFDPFMVFVGDAERIRELSSLIPIAHYLPDAWMFFGCLDGRAPLISHEAANKRNPFLGQLEVSLFERAIRCGKGHGHVEWSSHRKEIFG